MTRPDASLVLRAPMLIDGLGGPPLTAGLVAVAGRHIAYAGRADQAPPFPNARVLDLPRACLLPGLIDIHVHATYYWTEPDAGAYTYENEGQIVYSPALIALLAAGRLRQALEAGITTVRDAGAVAGIMREVQHAIARGLIPGPKVYMAGRMIIATGGHLHQLPGLTNEASGPHDFRRAVREEIRAGADYIKLANDGTDMSQEELDAAVDEAHRQGKKVACHTAEPPSWQMAITAGVDTLEHGTPTEREIDEALARGITWVPTLNISEAYAQWCDRRRQDPDPRIARQAAAQYAEAQVHLERAQTAMAYAVKAGLRIAAGTDSWLGGVRFAALADEIRQLGEYGCPPMQALQAATSVPARAMGQADIGALETGRLADIIAVAGDPLSDLGALERVRLVVREGEVVQAPSILTMPAWTE